MPALKVRTALGGKQTHLVNPATNLTLCSYGQNVKLVTSVKQLDCTCKVCLKIQEENRERIRIRS